MQVTTSSGAELGTVISEQVCGAAIMHVIRIRWAMARFTPTEFVLSLI
jgi:hypothetical protein